MANRFDAALFIAALAEARALPVWEVAPEARTLLDLGSQYAGFARLRARGSLTTQQQSKEGYLHDLIVDFARSIGAPGVHFGDAITTPGVELSFRNGRQLAIPTADLSLRRAAREQAAAVAS